MPNDARPATGGDSEGEAVGPQSDDELVFATQDLGRGEIATPPPVIEELGFAIAPRPEADPAGNDHTGSFVPGGRDGPPPPPPPRLETSAPSPPGAMRDGFVITQSEGVVPSLPVDALVVGAPVATPGASAGRPGFRISADGAQPSSPSAEPLWQVRDPAPRSAQSSSRRGWAIRHTDLVDRSANATMLRLREEAVHVSWKAAWIAVTAADGKLYRKRDF
jgi:hypothetical protein